MAGGRFRTEGSESTEGSRFFYGINGILSEFTELLLGEKRGSFEQRGKLKRGRHDQISKFSKFLNFLGEEAGEGLDGIFWGGKARGQFRTED
jgi:hypothetical protein